MNKLQRADWTLLVIDKSGAHLTPVQLQKSLFLLGKNLAKKDLGVTSFYDFEPYDYGPFCKEVYADAEELQREGFLSIERAATGNYKLYGVTSAGIERAAALRSLLQPHVADYLSNVVAFTQRLSFGELVSAIYKAYPDMKANSVFQG